jgi:hypothetical protein
MVFLSHSLESYDTPSPRSSHLGTGFSSIGTSFKFHRSIHYNWLLSILSRSSLSLSTLYHPIRTFFIHVGGFPILLTSYRKINKISPSMSLTFANITPYWGSWTIHRLSLIAPGIQWVFRLSLLHRPNRISNLLPTMTSKGSKFPKLPPRVKLFPLFKNQLAIWLFFPFFKRGGLLVKNAKSSLYYYKQSLFSFFFFIIFDHPLHSQCSLYQLFSNPVGAHLVISICNDVL